MNKRRDKQAEAAVATVEKGAAPKAAAQGRRISVPDAVAAAAKLFAAGQLDKAEHLSRQILNSRPKNTDALNILAVALHRKGQTDEAIQTLRKAIQINAAVPSLYSNLGEMQRTRGYLDAAAVSLARAVRLDPKSPQAQNNLGIVYYDTREFKKAEEHYRASILLDPNYAEAHNNLGNTMRAQGKMKEAIAEYERAIEIKENYPEAYNNMGTVFRDMGKTEEAEFSFRRAIVLRPKYLEALNSLASLLVALKRHEEALRLLGDTLKLYPTDVPTLLNVTRAQIARSNFAMADRAIALALKEAPDNAEAYVLKGQVSHELDRFDESVKSFEKALELKPNNLEALNYYGIVLKSVGRLEDARNTFLKALELQPNAMGTYSNFVDLEKFTADHPLFLAMKRISDSIKNPDDERFTALHFAMGKAYDDIGDYDEAIHHYLTGARLKRKTLTYNETEIFAFYDDIKRIFDKAYFEKLPYEGNPTTLPLFIIGMPRSGSTLVEQIISSHPKVYGAGEIKTLSLCLGLLRQKYPGLPRFPAMVTAMKKSHFDSVAKGYLDTVTAMAGTAERVSDKLLTNYFFVGLIHALFPNAKIIHTMRNPIDTCLSSFTKLFKDDMPHSYDLAELGRYYRKYQDIMQHWREVLPPGVMLDVQYEEVVADPEKNARRLIEFCGLEWNDQCLNFHESDRPVKTASVSQVRKPIYGTSVERWRRYGDRLLPLVEALKD